MDRASGLLGPPNSLALDIPMLWATFVTTVLVVPDEVVTVRLVTDTGTSTTLFQFVLVWDALCIALTMPEILLNV